MTVYRKEEGGITYFTTKEAKPPKSQLDALKKLQGVLSQSEFEDMKSRLVGGEEEKAPVASKLADLSAITDAIEFLGPKFQQSKDAREELAIALLNDSEDEEQVKLAAGVSWNVLSAWCYPTETYEEDGKQRTRKSTTPSVPKNVANFIERQAEKVAADRAADA